MAAANTSRPSAKDNPLKPGESTDRRVLRTRKAIRSAFHKLVITEGPGRISVSSLAREADIDRKTFYLHFASISDLADAESAMVAEELLESMRLRQRKDGASVVSALLSAFEDVFDRERDFYRAIMASLSIDRIVDYLAPTFLDYALDSQKSGDGDPVAMEYLVRFFLAGSLSVFRQWFTHEPDTSYEVMRSRMEAILKSTPLLGDAAL